jgi:hypothetical protein
MKKEYDFSKGQRGKFYRPGVKLNLPIYLEPDVEAFVRKYANKKKVDRQKIVNKWLRNNIETVKSVL